MSRGQQLRIIWNQWRRGGAVYQINLPAIFDLAMITPLTSGSTSAPGSPVVVSVASCGDVVAQRRVHIFPTRKAPHLAYLWRLGCLSTNIVWRMEGKQTCRTDVNMFAYLRSFGRHRVGGWNLADASWNFIVVACLMKSPLFSKCQNCRLCTREVLKRCHVPIFIAGRKRWTTFQDTSSFACE